MNFSPGVVHTPQHKHTAAVVAFSFWCLVFRLLKCSSVSSSGKIANLCVLVCAQTFVSRKNKILPALISRQLSRWNISQQGAFAAESADGILGCIRIPANAGSFPLLQVVWSRKGLQCSSHGSSRAQPGRPLQLLFSQVYDENSTYASRPGMCTPWWEQLQSPEGFSAEWVKLLMQRFIHLSEHLT